MMLTPFKGINQDPRKYIWMSPTGDDNNTGEKDYPVKSLRVAMELSRKYHKNILVKDGTYNLNDNPQTGTTYPLFESGMDGTFEYGFDSEIDNFPMQNAIRIYTPFVIGEYISEIDLLTFTSVTAVRDTSGSYSVITVSPDPSWTPNSLVGKRLYYRQTSSLYRYSYIIISNTSNTIVINCPLSGDMKSGTSLLSIGRCPVFTNTPSNFSIYNVNPISFINLDFNIGSVSSINIGGSSNVMFLSCYFSRPSAGSTPIYVSNGSLTLDYCVLNGLRVGHKQYSVIKSIQLINCRYTSVINNTEAAYYDVDTLTFCSAFNCYDIIHTGGYNYNNFGNRNIVIQNFGGSGNTGAFIRHHSSYSRNQFLNITLNWNTAYGSNAYTIDTRSIIPEEGVQLSLDTLSLQNVAAKQVIIYEDDLTRIIGKL